MSFPPLSSQRQQKWDLNLYLVTQPEISTAAAMRQEVRRGEGRLENNDRASLGGHSSLVFVPASCPLSLPHVKRLDAEARGAMLVCG